MKRFVESKLRYMPLSQHDANLLYKKHPEVPKMFDGKNCPSCHGDGYVVFGGERYECDCVEQLQKYKHYISAGIPIKYQKLSWADWDNKEFPIDDGIVKKYRDNLSNYVNNGIGLFLRGSNGSGKSFIATMILKELVNDGHSCYMTTAADMADIVKNKWKTDFDEDFYKTKIEQTDVLYIDDVGRELIDLDTNWADKFNKTSLDNIVRQRVQNGKTTFITTNLTDKRFVSYYGNGIKSLLLESMICFEVFGKDHREVIQEKLLSNGVSNSHIF